jgi:hypothetical protein
VKNQRGENYNPGVFRRGSKVKETEHLNFYLSRDKLSGESTCSCEAPGAQAKLALTPAKPG